MYHLWDDPKHGNPVSPRPTIDQDPFRPQRCHMLYSKYVNIDEFAATFWLTSWFLVLILQNVSITMTLDILALRTQSVHLLLLLTACEEKIYRFQQCLHVICKSFCNVRRNSMQKLCFFMKDTGITQMYFRYSFFCKWFIPQNSFRMCHGEQAMMLWADATDGGPIIDCEVRSLQQLGGRHETNLGLWCRVKSSIVGI